MTSKRSRFVRGNAKVERLLGDPRRAEAAERINAEMDEIDRVYLDTLAKVREAGKLTQAQLAAELGVTQGAVSQMERRGDMLLSTLRGYLTAVGAENPRILVTVDGVDMELAL